MSITLKESRETLFLLRVVQAAHADDPEEVKRPIQEADQLVAILTTIVKNTKARSL